MSEVEDIINGLLKLQKHVLGSDPTDSWVKSKILENRNNVAQLVVYDDNSSTDVRLTLDDNNNIVRTNEPPVHTIQMHVDTFLAILSNDMSINEAYLNGLISVSGENHHVHCLTWAKAFERLKSLLNYIKNKR
jgi:hypothetical protein